FPMSAGAVVNSVFSISSMLLGVPTGVKIFNWLTTLYKSKIVISVPMLCALAFMRSFVIGGVTGVMLGMAAGDYQYHNTYFLISHFHYVLIPGTVFACFAGLTFWYPKMFGHKINEKLGKWSFWLFVIGFHATFFPQYFLGLDGMARRLYTIGPEWMSLNMLSSIGAFIMGAGFALFVYAIYYSYRYRKREVSGDSWGMGRTLEWATPTPIPEYNFATLPEIHDLDTFMSMTERRQTTYENENLDSNHMSINSVTPFIMIAILFAASFCLVIKWTIPATIALIAMLVMMGLRSFEYDPGYVIGVEEIERTEETARGDENE